MKNLILLLFVFTLSLGLSAQNTANVFTMTGSGDTITNTTADSVVLAVNSYYKSLSIHATFTRITGTAAGNAKLYGTVDNTNYVQIGTDTLAMSASGVSSYVWIVDGSPYKKYKVIFTGSTTLTGSIRGYLMASQAGQRNTVFTMTGSGDTVTDSGTDYVELQVKNWYETVSIQAKTTKIGGTVGGTVTLQGSNNGTNYVTVNTAYVAGTSSTMTALNQTTTTKVFVITGSPYRYYRLSWTGTGTMSGRLYGYMLTQK